MKDHYCAIAGREGELAGGRELEGQDCVTDVLTKEIGEVAVGEGAVGERAAGEVGEAYFRILHTKTASHCC